MYLITVPMFGDFIKCSSKRKAFKYASIRSFLDNTRCVVYICDDNDIYTRIKLRLYDCGKLVQEV